MKILYVTGYRYPANLDEPLTSGDLRYSFTLSRALVKLGHEVTVITRKEKADDTVSNLEDVNIQRYKSELSRVFSTSFDISYNRYNLFKRLYKDADVIICNSPLTLELFLKIDVPILYIASGLEDVRNYSSSIKERMSRIAITSLRDPLKKLTWNRAHYVNTTAVLEDKTLLKWGIPEQKIGRVSSSVDLDRYKKEPKKAKELREKININDLTKIILNVSRFTPAKGITETICAFNLLPLDDTKLLIIGVHHSHDNTYFRKVQETIEASPKKSDIILLENIPESELPVYYTAADALSVFSKGYDPLPTVIIEAMACETPVLSTYYKTREQFIRDGETGLFVEEKNIEEWARKMNKLLTSTSYRQKIATKGAAFVSKNFSSVTIAKQIMEMLDNE